MVNPDNQIKSETSPSNIPDKDKPVWYLAYGSNINHDRFLTYIKGGKYPLWGNKEDPCLNTTSPSDNKLWKFKHKVYFGAKKGVAFIENEEQEEEKYLGRIWKITKGQFDEIHGKEGNLYKGEPIPIGIYDDGIDIKTFTTKDESKIIIKKPDPNYIITIAIGLNEIGLSVNEIIEYLFTLGVIEGEYSFDELKKEMEKYNEPLNHKNNLKEMKIMPGKRKSAEERVKELQQKIKDIKAAELLKGKKEDKKWIKIDPKIGSFVRKAFQNNFEGMTLDNLKAEIKKIIEPRKPGAKRGRKPGVKKAEGEAEQTQ